MEPTWNICRSQKLKHNIIFHFPMLKAFENTVYICIYTQCLLIMNNFGEHLQKNITEETTHFFWCHGFVFPPLPMFFFPSEKLTKKHMFPPPSWAWAKSVCKPNNLKPRGRRWVVARYPPWGPKISYFKIFQGNFCEWFSELPIRWDMLIHRNKNVDDFILQDNSRSSKVCTVVLS